MSTWLEALGALTLSVLVLLVMTRIIGLVLESWVSTASETESMRRWTKGIRQAHSKLDLLEKRVAALESKKGKK